MTYFISYDIQENKIRNKVAKYLEGIGYRHQYSLFRAELSEKEAIAVKEKLKWLTRTAEKALLLIIPICKSCNNKIWQQGEGREEMKNCVVI